MDEYLAGTWEEFEAWIRETIGGDFRWKIRPQDNASNREMVVRLINDAMKRTGRFPNSNAFLERTGE